MMELKDRIEAYGGDYDAIMGRFMGDEDFFLQILAMLFDDSSLPRLESALANGDLSRAFDAAHELKGVSGNLGLTPLYTAVCEIVEPLRAGIEQDYTGLLQTVHRSFQDARALLPQ